MQPELVVLDSVLDPSRAERQRSALSVGKTVAAVLPERVTPDGSWVVIENGRLLHPDEWASRLITPTTELTCYPRMNGAVGRIVAGAFLMIVGTALAIASAPAGGMFGWGPWSAGLALMGAGMAVGGIGELLTPVSVMSPTPQLSSGDQSGSATYGFSGISNSTRVGTPIGVVYGTHRVGGQVIGLSVKTRDDTDTLDMLIAVSEGPIQSIADVQINGQPIANFQNTTADTRLGEASQNTISFFGDGSVSTFTSSALLSPTFATYTTNGSQLTAIEVKIEFPGGLFTLDDAGNFTGKSVTIETQYKLHTAGTYTAGPTVTYTEAKRSYLRRIIRIDGLTPGQYDVQVRRTNAETTSSREADQCYRAAINECTSDRFTYPYTALIGVEAMATNQLSGGVPTITALAQGVKVRIFSTTTAYTTAYSANPSWIVLDMLTNERYGLGRFLAAQKWSQGTVSVTNGSTTVTGSGTGWTTANVLAGDRLEVAARGRYMTVSAVDAGTQTITLTSAWTGATSSGNAYTIRRDDLDLQSFIDWAAFCDQQIPTADGGTETRCETNIVFDADRQTVWDQVVKLCSLGQAFPVMMGTYLKIKTLKAESAVQLFTMGNIVKNSFEEVFLPLRERSNLFEVSYLNEDNNYQSDMVVLEDPLLFTNSEQARRQSISALGVTRMTEAARLARRYQNLNRYVTRTISFEVGLDAVACEPGDVIKFSHDVPQWGYSGRVASGSTANTVVLDHAVTLTAGKTYEILVRHADDSFELKTVSNSAGTYTTLTIPDSWLATPAASDLFAFGETSISTKPFRVTAIERTQDLTAKLTAVEYDARVYDDSAVSVGAVLNYSALSDLVGPPPAVTNLTLLEQGLTDKTLWVSFTPPGSLNYAKANIYRVTNGADVFIGSTATNSFYLTGISLNETVTIKVTSVSPLNIESNRDTAPTVTLTTSGSYPPDVVKFSDYYENGVTYITWQGVYWPVSYEYEIRKGATWDGSIVLGRTTTTRIPAAGDGTYWIAVRDVNGTYSLNPLSLTVTGAIVTENVVAALDEDGNGWTGSVSGGAIKSGSVIQLDGTLLWDSVTGLMDAGTTPIDYLGPIQSSGYYEIATGRIVNIGSAQPVWISASWTATIQSVDGTNSTKGNVTVEVAIAGNDNVYGAWKVLVPGQYVGKLFKFRIHLESFDTTILTKVTAFDITVDMPDRIETGQNVSIASGGTSITYGTAFQVAPTVHITIISASTGDTVLLTSQSTTGFTVQIKDSTNTGAARSVNWSAAGY